MSDKLSMLVHFAIIIILITYFAFAVASYKNKKHRTSKNIKIQIIFESILCILYLIRFILLFFVENSSSSLGLSLLCIIFFAFNVILDFNILKRNHNKK